MLSQRSIKNLSESKFQKYCLLMSNRSLFCDSEQKGHGYPHTITSYVSPMLVPFTVTWDIKHQEFAFIERS